MTAGKTSGDGALDPRTFRRALGNFATGVTVVTASADGVQVGVTANSFNSVSLDPPLILWSIDKRSGSYGVFEKASHFAVNILAADQIHLSNRFARPSEDRFAGVAHREGEGGGLLLDGVSAAFQCEKHQIVDGGDHWIMIGRVVAFDDHGKQPLLYHMGTYATALPHPDLQIREGSATAAPDLQRRLSDNYFYLMTQAVRRYQDAWQEEQLSRGWRTDETRVLLVLEADGRAVDLGVLVQQAAMPLHEVEAALGMLASRGLVTAAGAGHALTEAGRKMAQAAWELASQQQEKVFGRFTPAQRQAFKDVLAHVLDGAA